MDPNIFYFTGKQVLYYPCASSSGTGISYFLGASRPLALLDHSRVKRALFQNQWGLGEAGAVGSAWMRGLWPRRAFLSKKAVQWERVPRRCQLGKERHLLKGWSRAESPSHVVIKESGSLSTFPQFSCFFSKAYLHLTKNLLLAHIWVFKIPLISCWGVCRCGVCFIVCFQWGSKSADLFWEDQRINTFALWTTRSLSQLVSFAGVPRKQTETVYTTARLCSDKASLRTWGCGLLAPVLNFSLHHLPTFLSCPELQM